MIAVKVILLPPPVISQNELQISLGMLFNFVRNLMSGVLGFPGCGPPVAVSPDIQSQGTAFETLRNTTLATGCPIAQETVSSPTPCGDLKSR